MKAFIHKLSAVILAVLVMMSTITIAVEKHFCGDKLVDVSMFSELERCGMESPDSQSAMSKSCCKDTVDLIDGQDELKVEKINKSQLEKDAFVTIFLISDYILFDDKSEPEVLLNDYSPPDLYREVNILHEVFLI